MLDRFTFHWRFIRSCCHPTLKQNSRGEMHEIHEKQNCHSHYENLAHLLVPSPGPNLGTRYIVLGTVYSPRSSLKDPTHAGMPSISRGLDGQPASSPCVAGACGVGTVRFFCCHFPFSQPALYLLLFGLRRFDAALVFSHDHSESDSAHERRPPMKSTKRRRFPAFRPNLFLLED